MNGTRQTLGIALGGGGSRAFVHLGVLQRLEEEGLAPACASGSSMGAVLGALWARTPRMAELLPPVTQYFRTSRLFGALARPPRGDGLHARPGLLGSIARRAATWSVATAVSWRAGLLRSHPVNKAIDHFFGPDARIEDLARPFAANALDLTNGRVADFTHGPLAPALKAGVAIGLIFAPHAFDGTQYADAAPISPVPVELCRRLGAARVLAVDINAPLERPQTQQVGFDVVRRILSMQSELLARRELDGADLVLRIDASDVFWGNFENVDELVVRGWTAAGAILDPLRKLLED